MDTLRDKYLDTLGIPAYLYRQQETPEASTKPVKCLVLESTEDASFCQAGEVQDFLFKMLSAIGLKASDVALLNLEKSELSQALSQYQAQSILNMGCAIGKQAIPSFATVHPGEVLKNPELKREVWEVLKQLQSCLK